MQVLDDAGHPVAAGTLGNIVVKLPLPPGCLPTLWNADERFRAAYLEEFPGYYKTADAGYIDEDGYVFIMARTDDIINCAGHRLSTGAMEEVCASHPDVAECAVIGVADPLKGQVPCGFLVLKRGVSRETSAIEQEVVALVRERDRPGRRLQDWRSCVDRLPKTRSGKILRGTMQKIADGMPGRCRRRSTIPRFWRRSQQRCAGMGPVQAADCRARKRKAPPYAGPQCLSSKARSRADRLRPRLSEGISAT